MSSESGQTLDVSADVRRLRRLVLVLLAVNAVTIAVAGWAAGSGRLWTASRFMAEKYRLVDGQGKVIGGMAYDPHIGGPHIGVCDPAQTRLVGLMCDAEGNIGVSTRCGKLRGDFELCVSKDGEASLWLRDDDETVSVTTQANLRAAVKAEQTRGKLLLPSGSSEE